MADNFKNTRKSVNTKSNNLRNRLLRKRQRSRRKNKQYFKRKNHLRSTFRKKKSKMNYFPAPIPPSTNGWQHEGEQGEVAYWKARAISLEFENNMLHKHIKQMYMNMIPHNQQMLHNDGQYFERKNDEEYFSCDDKESVNNSKIKVKKESEDEEDSKPPSEQISKKREENMKRLYGSAWRTIIGMETALQLNYDVTVERNNSQYWPIVPIKNA